MSPKTLAHGAHEQETMDGEHTNKSQLLKISKGKLTKKRKTKTPIEFVKYDLKPTKMRSYTLMPKLIENLMPSVTNRFYRSLLLFIDS
jgi:hypothetical protein